MLLVADVHELIEETVRGVKDSAGDVDAALLAACVAGFDRALFFCPQLSRLKGLAVHIKETVKRHEMVPPDEVPGPASIIQGQQGQDALSLKAIFTIRKSMKAIRDRKTNVKAIAELAGVIRRHYPHEEILPPGSIIPAIYAPNPASITELREAVAPSGMDRTTFSGMLMKGRLLSHGAERNFLERIEGGYQSPTHKDPGHFKLTKATAHRFHEAFRELIGEEAPSITLPDFDEFAPPNAQTGPRRGQISKGLPVSWGNLIP